MLKIKNRNTHGIHGIMVFLIIATYLGQILCAQSAGNALDFDGNNQYITVNGISEIGTGYTIEAWFYADALPNGEWRGIVTNASGGDHGIWTNGDKIDYYANVASNLSSTSISAGKWYHVAIVYNGTNGLLYINGQLDPNFPVAIASESITDIYWFQSVCRRRFRRQN